MWEVCTYYKDWTGERKQKTKRGFAKKSEALEWERNFKLKEDQSISMTFGSFVEIYLKDLETRIKKNTFLTKKHIIETKILPYFGRRKLDEIRTSDVIQWQNEMMKLTKDNGELFSSTYLKTIHNQLSAILNHAVISTPYLGGESFAGEEAVWFYGQPVWSMNYVGRVVGKHFDLDFLREALNHVSEKILIGDLRFIQKAIIVTIVK